MSLLPRAPRLFAGGGQLGYESQLGNNAASTGGAAGKVGDALYQNLPPLAVPFVSVKRADLDGVRADIAQELSVKSDKLREDLGKMRDQALKDSKMTSAGKARVVKGVDGYLTNLEEEFRKNPALLASGAARTRIIQDFQRAIDPAFITGNVNGMASSERLRTDLGKERLNYGAYTADGKRLNKSNLDLIQSYQEDANASVNPLNLTVRNGTETQAIEEVDKLFKTPTSTFGGENASVGVGQIQGSQGEKYTVASSNGSQTTTNAPHVNELRAKMIGYTDKKGTYHRGDWTSVISEEARYGLMEPRLTKYDTAPLQAGEKVTVDMAGPNGKTQAVELTGATSGRSRREVLAYLEANPTPANQKALQQLERNREQLAERDVKDLLATRLGLQLINGTVSKASVSAARIKPDKAADEAGKLPSNLFAALNGASPAFGKDAENGTYKVLDAQGQAVTTAGIDPNTNKPTTSALQISPAVTVIKGTEGVEDWANKFITMDGLVDGKNGRVPISLGSLPKQMAVYHPAPSGMRQIQGGNQMSVLPYANEFKVISQNNTITWMPNNPNRGMAEYKDKIEYAAAQSANLKKQFDAGRITGSQYQQLYTQLQQTASNAGIGPYLSVDVAVTEETLLKASRPGKDDNGDTFIGRFGYRGGNGKGKALRPDQYLGAMYNDNTEMQRDFGWEMMSTADEKQYGITPDTWKTGLGSKSYRTKMLIPATNLQFNSSSKTVNENVKQAEYDAQEEKTVEVGNNYSTGSWGK